MEIYALVRNGQIEYCDIDIGYLLRFLAEYDQTEVFCDFYEGYWGEPTYSVFMNRLRGLSLESSAPIDQFFAELKKQKAEIVIFVPQERKLD